MYMQPNIFVSKKLQLLTLGGRASVGLPIVYQGPPMLTHLLIPHMTLGDKFYYAHFSEKGAKSGLPKDTWRGSAELGFQPTGLPD